VPVDVIEKFESRQVTTGHYPTVELRYTVRGTNDDVEARSALATNSPTLYDPWGGGLLFLPRDTISIQPLTRHPMQSIAAALRLVPQRGTVPCQGPAGRRSAVGGDRPLRHRSADQRIRLRVRHRRWHAAHHAEPPDRRRVRAPQPDGPRLHFWHRLPACE